MKDTITKKELINFLKERIVKREAKLKECKYATDRVFEGGRIKELEELKAELERGG